MLFDKASALLLASSNLLHPIKYQDDIIPQTPILSTYRRFDWDDTPANETLVYHDCFNGYHCAKLRVPMDWTVDKSEDNRTVEIAVIRLAATVPVTDSRYGGAVLLNPGGPGGSGVNMLLREGKSIRTITGAGPDADNTTARHFDIISFDPRGVNNTRPTFTCFPNYIERLIFELETQAYGVFDSSETAFTNYWTQIRTEADICSKRAIEEDIAEHMSTSNVVKDIVAIIERHGEWREKEARNLLRLSDNSDLSDSIKYHPGKELVQYMGFSYGTVLGATLADMFPDRVKRAVLDGVVDSFDYYQGGWLTNLQDTDLQIVKFGEYCWLGGPKNCPLYHADGPAVIVDRFSRIVQNLTSNPIGVPATSEHSADLATWSDLKQLFKSITYNPLTTFHSLAQILVQLEQGNGTALVQSRRSIKDKIKEGLSEECTRDGPYSSACVQHSAGFDDTISTAILCSDAEPQTNITREEYWKYAQKLMGQSKLIGDVWGIIRLRCTQWHARDRNRYQGSLNATTAHPMLFVGNTIDNVTPIRNAHKMSRGFPGSVVLQSDSEGHCSGSTVNLCVARIVRKYFQTGELPKPGTVCAPDRLPLDGYSEEEHPAMPKGETDEALWKALVQANKGS